MSGTPHNGERNGTVGHQDDSGLAFKENLKREASSDHESLPAKQRRESGEQIIDGQQSETQPLPHLTVDAQVILLDIEGTTTSISFVKDELFPYILDNVESYLTSHWDEDDTTADVEALRQQVESDKSAGLSDVESILSKDSPKEQCIESVVKNVRWQMGSDRKTTALKQLQGHMWVDAYKSKQVAGHLYEDVTLCMERWKKTGKSICIYSSGSVAAQKLLFTYSVNGDLTNLLSDYFDTKVGGKREADSYTKISEHLHKKPADILFLTDIIEEARAAEKAGMQVVIMLRPGNVPLTDEQLQEFKTMHSFQELQLTSSEAKAE